MTVTVVREGENSCQFCAWDVDHHLDLEPCEAVGPLGYYCTRPRGHVGDHVACGSLCLLEVWKDERS